MEMYMLLVVLKDLNGEINNGLDDIFLSKIDKEGNILWTRLSGTATDDNGHAITLDDEGNIYIGGITSGNLDNQSKIGPLGQPDAFLTKYNEEVKKYGQKFLVEIYQEAMIT